MRLSGSGNRRGYSCCHDSAGVFQTVEPATEAVSIVASPTIETNSQFFFGSGDGSSGYYAERPELTLLSALRANAVTQH